MPVKLVMLMDPIESIKPHKDSSLAMLLAAQVRGWSLHYVSPDNIAYDGQQVVIRTQTLTVFDDNQHWFEATPEETRPLSEFDLVLMRMDPPVDARYIYVTMLLQQAALQSDIVVANTPQALLTRNEKLGILEFQSWCAPTLVTSSADDIKHFVKQHTDTILKPLDGMGGRSIFRLKDGDDNVNVILETLLQQTPMVMIQRYIPAITKGDKRLLLIDGKPIDYALARIPSQGEHRGNLAAGGRGQAQPLSPRDYAICEAVGPLLKQRGISFAGLDVIGDYLTEINITSPTCIREIEAAYPIDIAGQLLDTLAAQL